MVARISMSCRGPCGRCQTNLRFYSPVRVAPLHLQQYMLSNEVFLAALV